MPKKAEFIFVGDADSVIRAAKAANAAVGKSEAAAKSANDGISKSAKATATAVEKAAKKTAAANDEAGKSFKAMSQARGLAAGAALTAGLLQGVNAEAANDKLAAQLGTTGKFAGDLGKIAGDLYADAYGDSLASVNDALKGVLQNGLVEEDASNAKIKSVTASVLDLATAFDQDLGSATRGVGQLIRTGMAKDARQALDIVTRGFQQGGDKADDLLDTLNEYGTQFRKLGIDGKTATGLISQGLKAGARDADIVADAIKEFAIRAVDGSTTTKQGFEAIGLSAERMSAQIAKGGPSAKAGLDTVLDRLRSVENPAKRAQIAVQLFGTQAEDLGEALYEIDPSTAVAGLGKVEGAAKRMGKTLNDNSSSNLEKFKRQLLAVGETLLAHPQLVLAAVGVYAGFKVLTTVVTGIKALRAAQLALNVAFLANPAVLITAGLVALGVGLVVAYKKSETFRDVVGAAFSTTRKVAAAAFDVITFGLRQFLTGIGKVAGVASKLPGMGWLKGVSKAAGAAAAKLAGISDTIRGIPDDKHLKLHVSLDAAGERALKALNRRGISVGGPTGDGFARGGVVPGSGDGDTVPAWLTPGEHVTQKKIVERFGPTVFADINEGRVDPRLGYAQRFTSGGIVARANSIEAGRYPYVWGGGHGRSGVPSGGPPPGFDCSGAVAGALGVSPRVSGQFASFGLPGPGSPNDTKIYANAKHVFAVFNGRGWGTSRENPGGGPGWLSYNHRSGFTIRHLEDGGAKNSGAGDAQETAESGRERRRAAAEKAGSRLVNKIAGRSAKTIAAATRSAAAIGGGIEDAGAAYGRLERRFGQTDEDLGTADGRAKRIDELKALKAEKKKQLEQQRKRRDALGRAVAAAQKQLTALQKARAKAKGAKRAKMNERIRAFHDRLVDLKAELKALGGAIQDTQLDIGDLDKEAADVAGTADTAVDAPTPTDLLGQALNDIDLQERAGVISPEAASAQRTATLQSALGGAFGGLDQRQQWEVMAQLRDAQQAATQATNDVAEALKDLKASIDQNTAVASSTMAVQGREALRLIADLLSGELGNRYANRRTMPGAGSLARIGNGGY